MEITSAYIKSLGFTVTVGDEVYIPDGITINNKKYKNGIVTYIVESMASSNVEIDYSIAIKIIFENNNNIHAYFTYPLSGDNTRQHVWHNYPHTKFIVDTKIDSVIPF